VITWINGFLLVATRIKVLSLQNQSR